MYHRPPSYFLERPFLVRQHAAQVLEEMTTSSTCTDGEMFNIVAPIAPIFEGCFQDIGIDLFGEAVYIQTEGSGPGEAIMFPFKSDETSSVLTEVSCVCRFIVQRVLCAVHTFFS